MPPFSTTDVEIDKVILRNSVHIGPKEPIEQFLATVAEGLINNHPDKVIYKYPELLMLKDALEKADKTIN